MIWLLAATAAAFALFVTLLLRTLVRLIRRRIAGPGGPGVVRLLFRHPAFRADRWSLGLTALATVGLAANFAKLSGLLP
jgi:hypothetical protein